MEWLQLTSCQTPPPVQIGLNWDPHMAYTLVLHSVFHQSELTDVRDTRAEKWVGKVQSKDTRDVDFSAGIELLVAYGG